MGLHTVLVWCLGQLSLWECPSCGFELFYKTQGCKQLGVIIVIVWVGEKKRGSFPTILGCINLDPKPVTSIFSAFQK